MNGERDVGVGGETSALNFREDMLTSRWREQEGGITNVRFPLLSTEPLVFLYQPRAAQGKKSSGKLTGDISQAGRDGWPGEVRSRTHTHIVRKPFNDCRREHSK